MKKEIGGKNPAIQFLKAREEAAVKSIPVLLSLKSVCILGAKLPG